MKLKLKSKFSKKNNVFANKLLVKKLIMWFEQLIPNVVSYENWTTVSGDHIELPANIRTALQRKGHVLQSLAGGTICQFIVQGTESYRQNGGSGKLVAVSDPRKGGFPAGFWRNSLRSFPLGLWQFNLFMLSLFVQLRYVNKKASNSAHTQSMWVWIHSFSSLR